MAEASEAVDLLYREHRDFLWGLSYRLTGDPAEAEDIVQETFVRAMKQEPAGAVAWRPWLTRVAVNLGRDLLRWRRRRGYAGPWLPGPVPTGEEATPEPADPREPGPEARYDRTESLSAAFLIAVEALTPSQRAALILRDVLGHSAREAAELLGVSEENVRTLHARARRALEAYDASRRPPSRTEQERTQEALGRFLQCLGTGDVAGLERMLAEDVTASSDSGGAFRAARRPIVGRKNVMAFLLGAGRKSGLPDTIDITNLNGLPALVLTYAGRPARVAPRLAMQLLLDASGHIARIHTVMAPRKLAALPPLSSR